MANILPYNSCERADAVSSMVRDWWNRPLEWGLWDCAQMCREMALKLGAQDPIGDWGSYASKSESLTYLKRAGFKSLQDLLDAKCERLDSIGFAGLGDIIEFKSKWRAIPALGIYTSPDSVLMFLPKINDVENIEWQNVRCGRFSLEFATGNAWRVV